MTEPIWEIKKRVPSGFWEEPNNRFQYMKWLGERLGFKENEDWYKITYDDFQSNNGGGLLASYYQHSPSIAVMENFPNYDWKEWFFYQAPKYFWKKPENRYRYMKWLGEQLGFTKIEDWYRITYDDFQRNKGNRLLAHYYQDSPSLAAMQFYPEYDWKEWFFGQVSKDFWKKQNNRHRYMKWLGDQLGFKKTEDWYNITAESFNKNYGSACLKYYQSSPINALEEYFSNYKWEGWLFNSHVPNNFWNKKENRLLFIKWLGRKLGYRSQYDWYKITQESFKKFNGNGLLQYYQIHHRQLLLTICLIIIGKSGSFLLHH